MKNKNNDCFTNKQLIVFQNYTNLAGTKAVEGWLGLNK